jgi:protein TonB
MVQPQSTPASISAEPAAEAPDPPAGRGVEGGVPGGVPGGVLGGTPWTSGPLRTGGNVTAPVVLERIQPEYPAAARFARVEGQVKLEAVIRSDGTVGDVKVLQGLRLGCTEAAIEALKHWRFRPGERDGVPADVYFELTVDFVLG